jgi:intracellular septation protein A
MIHYSLSYSLKVWLTSVLAAPLILIATDYCFYHKSIDFNSMFQIYFMLTIAGAIFSLITWLIFWGAANLACHYIPDSIKRKLIMCFSGIILTIITCLLIFLEDDMGLSLDDTIIYIILAYCMCIAAGSLFYNLGPDESIS